jgi:hypothetical protein
MQLLGAFILLPFVVNRRALIRQARLAARVWEFNAALRRTSPPLGIAEAIRAELAIDAATTIRLEAEGAFEP